MKTDSEKPGPFDRLTLGLFSYKAKPADEVDRMINANYAVKQDFLSDPGIKSGVLMDSYLKAREKYLPMLRFASFVDRVDMVLSPLEAILILKAPKLGAPLMAAELGLKAAFILYYTAKTDDFKDAAIFAANEAFGAAIPYGNMIDILPLYIFCAQNFVRQKAFEYYIDAKVSGGKKDG
jgi:hypothetical protein